MPVLPLVGSTITLPFFSRPRFSASSIMARAIRSLTLDSGLRDSSFSHDVRLGPVGHPFRRTSGVFPTSSRTFVLDVHCTSLLRLAQ